MILLLWPIVGSWSYGSVSCQKCFESGSLFVPGSPNYRELKKKKRKGISFFAELVALFGGWRLLIELEVLV
jgi:hypothetical protein